jgi:adenylosuccinate synthase
MKKAIEYKKKNNLEEPNKKMKGIMHSNAFQSLDVDYLESLARNVGVDISVVSVSSEKEENHDVQLSCE